MQKENKKITQSQTNPFEFSDDNKRYHTWNYHLRHKFGGKVFKVSLDCGFTCPNIDGTKGTGGCIYCSAAGSGDFAGSRDLPIEKQFETVKNKLHKKWDNAKYIAYFQAFTNTYAPLCVLREKYERALEINGVVGLSIATRADCLKDDVVSYLSELSKRTYLIVELGLQTAFDSTARFINRGHTFAEFINGYNKLRDNGINVCVHIINGLPGETQDMMIKTARTVANLNPHSVKIHLLHILKNTAAEKMYQNGVFSAMSMDDYVKTVCGQLTLFSPETIIQRVTGDGAKSELIAPLWGLKKFVVMDAIDKYMFENCLYQGINYQGINYQGINCVE